jgi:hypothetical protein
MAVKRTGFTDVEKVIDLDDGIYVAGMASISTGATGEWDAKGAWDWRAGSLAGTALYKALK